MVYVKRPVVGRLPSIPTVVEVPFRLRLDQFLIITAPRHVVGRRKRFPICDPDGQLPGAAGTDAILQAGVARAAPGENEHHAPVERAEDAGEGRLVDGARLRTTTRMGVNPQSRKTFRRQAAIDLLVKEIRHRPVVELHGHGGTDLLYQANVFNQQRILVGGDSEAADFGGAEVAPIQQFRPSGRREP